MEALSLFAKLTLDTSQYEAELKGAGDSASSFGGKLKGGLASAAKIGGIAIGAVATAAAAVTKSVWDGTAAVAQYGDNIDKMSQKMGLSAEAYQEWDFIMQHNGTSIDSLQAGMKTLANAVESGNDAFSRLGITQDDIASMSQEELFSATISALQNVDDETERTYLAGQLLGRGATELGALLNMSAEETEAMRQQVHDLGGVMSDEAVAAAAGFQDSLQNLQTGFTGLKNSMLSQFLPATTTIMDGLTAVITGDSSGLGMLNSGIQDFVDNLSGVIPDVLNVGASIVSSLAGAVIENLPSLMESGLGILMTLGESLIENLPLLFEVAGSMLLTLATGLSESLPTLIPSIVGVILQIVETLTDPANLTALVDAAVSIIMGLANGLIAALPQLIAAAPVIISNLVTGIVSNIPTILQAGLDLIVALGQALISAIPQLLSAGQEIITTIGNGVTAAWNAVIEWGSGIVDKVKEGFSSAVANAKEWGSDLINNFIDGLKQKWENLKATVSGVASTIRDFLGFSEPKLGPLSNFHTYAPDMMKLFAQGIKENEGLVRSQIESSFDFGSVGIAPAVETSTEGNAWGDMRDFLVALAERPIVLDDGTLVGAIAPSMDANLGGRYGFAERGLAV